MRRLAALVATLALLAGCGSGSSGSSSGSTSHSGSSLSTSTLQPISRVVLVMEENKDYGTTVGHMPYLDPLRQKYAQLTNYWGTNFPSGPNYMVLTSGVPQPAGDCVPSTKCRSSAANIFQQLGAGWAVWAESMTKPCLKSNIGKYVPRHTAAPYYTNLGTSCAKQDVPLPSTPTIAARFTLVAPNLCNDMHDCSVATGDNWLKTFLPKLLGQAAFTNGSTLIVVTWDTGAHNCGSNCQSHVEAVLMNPRLSGLSVTQKFTHNDMLALFQSLLGVPPLGGAKAVGTGLRTALGL